MHEIRLSGTNPTEVGVMNNLDRLFASSIYISGSIPSEVSLMTDLQRMTFVINSITDKYQARLVS